MLTFFLTASRLTRGISLTIYLKQNALRMWRFKTDGNRQQTSET